MKKSYRQSGCFLSAMLLMFSWLSIVLTSAGCKDSNQPPPFQEALRYLDQDQPQQAIAAFEKAIVEGQNEFESHMQLGLLSEQFPERVIMAVWHYRQCLEMEPNNQHQMAIKQWLERTEKNLLAELKNKLEKTGEEEKKQRVKFLEEHALRQKEWIAELAQENRDLRQRLAELQSSKNKK